MNKNDKKELLKSTGELVMAMHGALYHEDYVNKVKEKILSGEYSREQAADEYYKAMDLASEYRDVIENLLKIL